MIELTIRTAGGPMVIQLSTPVATAVANRPCAIEVRLNCRPSTLVGEDPLEALKNARPAHSPSRVTS